VVTWEESQTPAHAEIFQTVRKHLAKDLQKTTSFFCVESLLATAVHTFLSGFPGEVSYAVKCLPEPKIICSLARHGIRKFDVASLNEIQLVSGLCPGATLFFNHPVKSRESIGEAITRYGVRNFVVDSHQELQKFLDFSLRDICLTVRIAVPTGSEKYDFAAKFGCNLAEAEEVAKAVYASYGRYGLTFHVGSQCTDENAYVRGLQMCRSVADRVGAEPHFLNVGGGFPVLSNEPPSATLPRYFQAIRDAAQMHRFPALICEPGRALVGASGVAALPIELVSRGRIFLSDGVYGLLGELNYLDCDFPLSSVLAKNGDVEGLFQLFGPTCDSFDQIERRVRLKTSIAEGDWILFGNLGAYSWSLASSFNGFSDRKFFLI